MDQTKESGSVQRQWATEGGVCRRFPQALRRNRTQFLNSDLEGIQQLTLSPTTGSPPSAWTLLTPPTPQPGPILTAPAHISRRCNSTLSTVAPRGLQRSLKRSSWSPAAASPEAGAGGSQASPSPGQPSPALQQSEVCERSRRATTEGQGRRRPDTLAAALPAGLRGVGPYLRPRPGAAGSAPPLGAPRAPQPRLWGLQRRGSSGRDAGSARREATGAKPRGKRSSSPGSRCPGAPRRTPPSSFTSVGSAPAECGRRPALTQCLPEPRQQCRAPRHPGKVVLSRHPLSRATEVA